MKKLTPAHPRAIALLFAVVALPQVSAIAQEAAPPVVEAAPTPPVAAPAPPPAAAAPVFAPPSPIVQNVPPPGPAPVAEPAPVAADAEAAPAPARRIARPTTRTPAARATPAPVEQPAPVAATPVAPVDPAPPLAETPASPPEAVADPVDPVPEAVENEASGNSAWLWPLAGAAALVGLAALLFSRRRRATAASEYQRDEYVAEPVMAAPAILSPAASPVVAPVSSVAERPWIELGLRPVRAGTSADKAVVEFALTIANSGPVVARDVRVSAWMLIDAASAAERMLIDPPADAAVTEMTLDPGDGKSIDASLALPKSNVGLADGASVGSFMPVVVTEARYPLPDGTTGRISASFAIGRTGEGNELAPFAIDGEAEMHDNVDSRMHGALERT